MKYLWYALEHGVNFCFQLQHILCCFHMKVLFIRFSSIGDIVLTTPVIRCFKQQMPDAEVHYLTKASFRGILQANKYIDQAALPGKINLIELIESLKE